MATLYLGNAVRKKFLLGIVCIVAACFFVYAATNGPMQWVADASLPSVGATATSTGPQIEIGVPSGKVLVTRNGKWARGLDGAVDVTGDGTPDYIFESGSTNFWGGSNPHSIALTTFAMRGPLAFTSGYNDPYDYIGNRIIVDPFDYATSTGFLYSEAADGSGPCSGCQLGLSTRRWSKLYASIIDITGMNNSGSVIAGTSQDVVTGAAGFKWANASNGNRLQLVANPSVETGNQTYNIDSSHGGWVFTSTNNANAVCSNVTFASGSSNCAANAHTVLTVAASNVKAQSACTCSLRGNFATQLIYENCDVSSDGTLEARVYNPTGSSISSVSTTVDFCCVK